MTTTKIEAAKAACEEACKQARRYQTSKRAARDASRRSCVPEQPLAWTVEFKPYIE